MTCNAIDDFSELVHKDNIGNYFETVVTLDNSPEYMYDFIKLIYILFYKYKSNLVRVIDVNGDMKEISTSHFFDQCRNSRCMKNIRDFLYMIYPNRNVFPYFNFIDNLYTNNDFNFHNKNTDILTENLNYKVTYDDLDIHPFKVLVTKAAEETPAYFIDANNPNDANYNIINKYVKKLLKDEQTFTLGFNKAGSDIFRMIVHIIKPVIIDNEEYFIRLLYKTEEKSSIESFAKIFKVLINITSEDYAFNKYNTMLYNRYSLIFTEK